MDKAASDIVGEVEMVISEKVTREVVDDILCAAFEGGCTSGWVNGGGGFITEPKNQKLDTLFNHEIISMGGSLIFILGEEYEVDGVRIFVLDLDTFLKGLSKACSIYGHSVERFHEEHDAETADVVVQLALFGKVVFG